MEKVWRPSPKFILRRDAIRRSTRGWSPGLFLEVGAGTGTMTASFLERGFHGVCWDVTPENRQILRENLSRYTSQVEVPDALPSESEREFEYLFAFEVLEHIRNDLGALYDWAQRLKFGGRVLISVPAHQRKFSKEDEYVGHYRRYEKEQLRELLDEAGFSDIQIFNYGFPLGNITGFISRRLALSGTDRDELTKTRRSTESGVRRSKAVRLVGRFCNDFCLLPFRWAQRPFFSLDIGDGYVATARLGQK